jgi:succinoglycan biosynthesis protein ExoO
MSGTGLTCSVIIPAYRAETTILRALESLKHQTDPHWQAVIVSDDGVDYQAVLQSAGFDDPRLLFVSTGVIGSGCHRARNVGLRHATGEAISWLDADDAWHPERLARLLPLAKAHGAACDLVLMIDECSLKPLPNQPEPPAKLEILDLAAFMRTNQPLVPVMMRAYAAPRIDGVEMAEDVLANIRLIDAIGALALWPQRLYHYYIRPTSLAHSTAAEDRFDQAYSDYLLRLETGDGFGLSQASRSIAIAGLQRKQALNRAYKKARLDQPGLSFQDFISGHEA